MESWLIGRIGRSWPITAKFRKSRTTDWPECHSLRQPSSNARFAGWLRLAGERMVRASCEGCPLELRGNASGARKCDG
jgi:hypothetical protein